MTPSMIRAMANTLSDNDVDPCDVVAAATTLIRSGFPAKDIEGCWDEVMLMAMMRRVNERRKMRQAS